MQIQTVKIPADNRRGYKIVNADDPRASNAPAAIGPDDVAKMKRREAVELLEAHGFTDHGKMKVAEVRAMLCKIMFMEG